MSLTLEIPAEIERELREVARRQGSDLGAYILHAALEQTRREAQESAARLQALQELADLSQELDLDSDQALDQLLDELEVPAVGLSDHALTRASFYED